MAWYHYILATLFAFLAIVLMGVILLQRGKGVGLSGAFGGAGGHTAFGAKTGDVLTWATIVVATALLTFAVILNYVFVPPTPFAATPAPPPAPLTLPPDAGTQTPSQAPAPTEGARPAAPVETTPPAGAQPPTETAPPPEQKTPVPPQDTPDGSWNPGGRAAWPQYARHDILGVNLG